MTLREHLRRLGAEDVPLGRALGLYGLFQLLASFWDLPGSYSWENDGVAPRDLFVGIADNLTPGKGHTYPLLHFALLGLLCLPILLHALGTARSLAFTDVYASMLTVPTMTAISVVAKLVSVVMGLVAIWALGRVVRRTVSPGAGRWAAAFAATCLSVGYYGRTVNLDGPYLMWTALAMDALLSSAEHGRRQDYLRTALFVAASVATKDQAYATYVLSLPVYWLLLPLLYRRTAPNALYPNWSLGRLAGALGVFLLGLGALGGGLWNPTGFVYRWRLLTGPNTESWRLYPATLAGKLSNLGAIARNQADAWWPWPAVAVAWVGVAVALSVRPEGGLRRRSFRLLPLVAGLSSLCFFSLIVARTEHRFLLPLGFWLSAYGGVAVDAAVRYTADRARPVVRVAGVGLLGFAGLRGIGLVATQWGDARHDVARYLARLPAGTEVETYGRVTYQPHYSAPPAAPYRVRRVGPEPVRRRDPLVPGEEVVARFGEELTPPADVLVITEGFAGRFLRPAPTGTSDEARGYFTRALGGKLPGYERVEEFRPRVPACLRAWGMAPIEIHGSTGQRAWVLRRMPPGYGALAR
jgi:hypothetical protein